jgi:hypothetical protein
VLCCVPLPGGPCTSDRGIKSGDILLETTDGRTLRFDAAQQRLLNVLRLSQPERLGVDAERSGDSTAPLAENSVNYPPQRRFRA